MKHGIASLGRGSLWSADMKGSPAGQLTSTGHRWTSMDIEPSQGLFSKAGMMCSKARPDHAIK
jgi:hypothetical protein